MSSLRTDLGRVVANEARWLASFVERGRGWLARSPDPNLALGIPLSEGERLHSIGMHFPLEIAYCDAAGKVLRIVTLPPFRIAPAVAGAVVAWELVPGKLEGITVGERLLCD
ncbi:hypothetical protein [Armatimonas sp.]|uniref:hypothetical protein n=1 Tax=Armatimonas sp. TaxID=1872638 RepID=UPI00286D2A79|nr:hypothetical protein [Armatimonas sp.]